MRGKGAFSHLQSPQNSVILCHSERGDESFKFIRTLLIFNMYSKNLSFPQFWYTLLQLKRNKGQFASL